MPIEKMSDAKIFTYEFDVEIARTAEDVWTLISEEIDAWWMADFRVLGEGSVVTLDVDAGGCLLEKGKGGEVLEWYRVQMYTPGKSLYLVGHMAPEWGGPTTSMLKLSLESRGDACVLTVSDALMGNVTEKSAQNLDDGWRKLFGDSLKRYAEN